jgi:protein TonB
VDLTFRHPSFESSGAPSPSATLWTASPATVAALMHGAARQTRTQFAKRWSVPAALVVALHVIAGIAIVKLVDRPPQPPIAERELTVSLIASPAPVAVAVAPPEPKPVPKPTPKPVVKHVTPRVQPVVPPSPVLATQAPSTTTVAAPPATPAPPAPSEAKPDAAAAPSTAPSHASSGAPVSVAHLSCDGDAPAYPMLSKRHGETGTAVVAITVDTHGVVRSATLRTSSGFPRLDDAALQAARERSCQPYVENGTPVVATALLPFAFHLQD